MDQECRGLFYGPNLAREVLDCVVFAFDINGVGVHGPVGCEFKCISAVLLFNGTSPKRFGSVWNQQIVRCGVFGGLSCLTWSLVFQSYTF